MQWLDKSDCVGAWQNEKVAAVVFCTADCLTQLRNLDGMPKLIEDLKSNSPEQSLIDLHCLQSIARERQDKNGTMLFHSKFLV